MALRSFEKQWTCVDAVLLLFFSNKKIRERYLSQYVTGLLHGVKLDFQGLQSEDRAIAISAVDGIRDILELVDSSGEKNSNMGKAGRGSYKLPAILWISWALRKLKLPLSVDCVCALSAWLLSDVSRDVFFQHKEVEPDSGTAIWKGMSRMYREDPKTGPAFGYGVLDLVNRRYISIPSESNEGETVGKKKVTFGATDRMYAKTWRMLKRPTPNYFSDGFKNELIGSIKLLDRDLSDLSSPQIFNGKDARGKYICLLRKSLFLTLLKKKFPQYQHNSEAFLTRGLSSLIAFPAGRPKKT